MNFITHAPYGLGESQKYQKSRAKISMHNSHYAGARKLYLNTEKFFNNAMLLCIEKFLLLYLLILLQIKCLYRV